MEWEKIFANDVMDKGLTSKIYKVTQLNNKQTNFSHPRGQKGQEIREKNEKAREFKNRMKLREKRLEDKGN